MSELGRYGLSPRQVPPPPQSTLWVDGLRWCLAVMDCDDPAIGITAGLLSFSMERRYFTDRQEKAAHRIFQRVHNAWEAGVLDCQREQGLRLLATSLEADGAS